MPAGAVIQRPQALSGITGRKGCVGGAVSLLLKFLGLTQKMHEKRQNLQVREAYGTHGVGVKSVDIMGNTKCEGSTLAYI